MEVAFSNSNVKAKVVIPTSRSEANEAAENIRFEAMRAGVITFVGHVVFERGDKITLQVDASGSNGVRFRIQSERKLVRLFGQDIWVDVIQLPQNLYPIGD